MGLGKTYSTKYLLDSNNSSGVAGQVLSTTSTGIDWVDANTVPGTGLWLANGNDIYNSNSGNVGIGVTSPVTNLQITSSGSPSNPNASGTSLSTGSRLRFSTSGGASAVLDIGISSTPGAWIQARDATNFATLNYSLLLNPNGGNVGIGTTSPNDALEVAGNSATTHRIRINNANASGTETLAFVQDTTFKSWVEYNNSNGNFDIWQYTNNDLRFGTNNTERMRIDSSGNVGIGVTGPSYKLDVEGDVRLGGTNAQNYPIKMGRDNYAIYLGGPNINTINVGWETNTDFDMHINYVGYAGGVTQFRNLVVNDGKQGHIATFDGSSGNVGIGTTSPDSLLEISKAQASGPILKITEPTTINGTTEGGPGNNLGVLGFVSADTSTSQANLIRASVEGQPGEKPYGTGGLLTFNTMQTYLGSGTLTDLIERMRITAAGNVGIGTASPSQKLHLQNGVLLVDSNTPAATGIWMPDTNGNPSLRIVTDQSAANYSSIVNAWGNSSNTGIMVGSTRNDGFAFQVRSGVTLTDGFANDTGNSRMVVLGNGNVGIGTTGPGEPLTVKTKTDAYFPGIKVEDYDSSMGLYIQNLEDYNSGIGTGRYYNSNFWRSDVTAPTAIRLDGGAIRFYAQSGVTADVNYTPTQRMNIAATGAIQFNAYNDANNTGTPTYLLGTDGSGNIVKTTTVPGSGAGPYLPLSAGSSYPLTDTLYIQPTGSPTNTMLISARADDTYGNIQFTNAAETANWTELRSTSTQFTINNVNVGIGTTNPAYKLVVYETGTATSNIAINARATGAGTNNYAVWAEGSGASSTNFAFYGAAGKNAFLGDTGIGTDDPDEKLHVVGNVFLNANSAFKASYNNTDNYHGSMRWAGLQLGNNGTNRIVAGRTNTGGGFQFWTNNTTDAADYTVTPDGIMTMAMTETGNVGIGTTNPNTNLEIGAATNVAPKLRLTLNDSGNSIGVGQEYAGIQWKGNDGQGDGVRADIRVFGEGTSGETYMAFGTMTSGTSASTNAVERMRIDSAGNVGIGLTPNANYSKLQVKAPSSSYGFDLVGRDAGSNGESQITFWNSNQATQLAAIGNISDNLIFYTSTAERMRITSGGSVLVNTTSEQYISSGRGVIEINGDTGAGKGSLLGLKVGNTHGGYILADSTQMQVYNHLATPLKFFTNANERMRIDSSGNVGIGLTNPAVPLDIEGKIRSTNDNSGSYLEMFNDGDVSGNSFIKSTSGELIIESANDITFSPNSSEKMRITSTGDIELAASSRIVLDDQPTASTASGSGTIVKWSVSESTTAGTLYAVKSNGGWTTTDADIELRSIGMLGIALGSNATAGMLLQGFFYKSAHGFTIGLPLYISNTPGAFSTTRPTGANDYVRIIGYATSANYIYFDPDKTWVQVA